MRHGAEPVVPQQSRRDVPRGGAPGRMRVRRGRRRARRDGRRRRRLRCRWLARHRAHELLRTGDHALPQLRIGRVRGLEPQGRAGRQPEVRRLRRQLRRRRQRRLEGHLHRERPRVRPACEPQAAPHLPPAETAVPQPGERPLRRRVRGGGNRHHLAKSRTRLRVRRYRQRRERRHRRQQSGRSADAAAQRRRKPAQLAADQVCRHAIEPVRDRYPGEDHERRTSADRRGHERIELLLPERLPPPLRPRPRRQGRPDRHLVAVGRQGDRPRPPGQPPLCRRRDEGHRQPASVWLRRPW